MGRKPEIDKPQQQTFTTVWAATGDPVYAAEQAGYAHPRQMASDLAKRPLVEADFRRKQLRRINDELLPLAINRLRDILVDEKASRREWIEAAKVVVKHATSPGAEAEAKQPHEMTREELQTAIALNQARLAVVDGSIEEAELVEDEPVSIDLVDQAEPSVFD